MLIELLADIAKMTLFVACTYAAINVYVRRVHSDWAERLTKRRVAILAILTFAVGAIKVIEDVVAKESGPVDEMVLWFIRDQVPSSLTGFFTLVTLSGSRSFLLPVTLMAAAALLITRHRVQAAFLCTAMLIAPLVVYTLKMIVDRARPALWETQWYWGSSFPSGHTLGTAAFSTAAALCIGRIWPRYGNLAMVIAAIWTSLVALSRLVLGVHWPSDVLAAICIGAFISLAINIAFELKTVTSRCVR